VDLRKSSTIRFAAVLSFPVLTFGPFPSPDSLSTALGHAIGTIPLPPKWALGYHQCRWSYEPAARVVEIAKTFREKKIPCDVIWMDIDYMDNFRCFTFHPVRIPVTLWQFEFVGNTGVDHWRLYRCNMDLIDSLLVLWIVFFLGWGVLNEYSCPGKFPRWKGTCTDAP
jgi:hypothetical protein